MPKGEFRPGFTLKRGFKEMSRTIVERNRKPGPQTKRNAEIASQRMGKQVSLRKRAAKLRPAKEAAAKDRRMGIKRKKRLGDHVKDQLVPNITEVSI
jgi:hypothetical protein